MFVEADRFLKQRSGIVDESIDAACLLEDLDSAGSQESTLRLDAVILDEVFPGSGSKGLLDTNHIENILVL